MLESVSIHHAITELVGPLFLFTCEYVKYKYLWKYDCSKYIHAKLQIEHFR